MMRFRNWLQRIGQTSWVFALGLPLASTLGHAQSASKIRKPYVEEVVVEANAVVVALPQTASRWRTLPDGQSGFYGWRIDVKGGPGLSVVLAADTMMRVANLAQIVNASSLRRCEDPTNHSARSCTLVLPDSIGMKDNFLQMILRDEYVVAFFQEVRPATVRVTTYSPHGRFIIDRYRVRYRSARR